MVDQFSQDDEFDGYPGWLPLLLGALVFAAFYLMRHGAGASSREWGYFLFGCVVLGFTAMDLKAGWALSFLHRPVKRSKEPGRYWTYAVIEGACGIAAVLYSMGASLGYRSV